MRIIVSYTQWPAFIHKQRAHSHFNISLSTHKYYISKRDFIYIFKPVWLHEYVIPNFVRFLSFIHVLLLCKEHIFARGLQNADQCLTQIHTYITIIHTLKVLFSFLVIFFIINMHRRPCLNVWAIRTRE